jgi:hypothetical protein
LHGYVYNCSNLKQCTIYEHIIQDKISYRSIIERFMGIALLFFNNNHYKIINVLEKQQNKKLIVQKMKVRR